MIGRLAAAAAMVVVAVTMVAPSPARARPALEATTTARPALEATTTARPALEATTTARPALEATSTARPALEATSTARPALEATTTARPALDAIRAQTTPTTSTPSSPAGAGATSQIQLTSQTTWVGDNQEFTIGLAVTTPNPGSARLQLSVFPALTSRSAFDASLAGHLFTGAIRVFDPVSLSSLGSASALSVAVNPRSGGAGNSPQSLLLSASGVYPVLVALYDPQGNLLTQLVTHLLYSAPDARITRLDVAWVAPFSAPPSSTDADLAGLLPLSQAVAAHPNVAVTVAATPETIDSLAGGNGADKAAVTQLAQAVGDGTREVVAEPYVRLDLPSLLGAGLESEIGPQLETGNEVLASSLHAVPTSATWIETGPLSAAAVDDLAGRGVRQIVVAANTVSPLPPADLTRTLAQPFAVMGKTSRIAALAVDAGLAAHFDPTTDESLAAHQLLADLAMIQLELPNSRNSRGVVIVPPGGWQPNAAFLATFLDGLESAPILTTVSVDQLFSQVNALQVGTSPLVRTLVPPEQQPKGPPITDGAAIRAARQPVASLATVLPSGAPVISEVNRRILVSESADLPDRSRPAELAGATKLISELTTQVRLPGNQSITFTARQGLIPITVLSSASYPLRVQIRVSSQKLGFRSVRVPGGSCTESATSAVCTVTLTTQNTTIRVPVVARTSGVFSLTVSVQSPDGGLTLATEQDTVRSTAASEVGVILSVGAVLLLAVWWVRDVRHGRRARRLIPPEMGGFGPGRPTRAGLIGTRGPGGAGRSPPATVPAPAGGTGPFRSAPGAGAPAGAGRVSPAVGVASPPRSRASVGLDQPPSGTRASDRFWDDASSLVTQPIPIIPVDLPLETPQPSITGVPVRVPTPGDARRRVSSPPPRTRPAPTPEATSWARPDPEATSWARPDPEATSRARAAPPPAPAGAPAPGEPDSFSRNTVVMAGGTLLSRLTGFGRVLALIWAFGITTGVTDVYNVANTAPNILYDLVLGGILSATLVPVFVDYLNHDDPEEGRRAISAVVTTITVTLIALSVVFWLVAPEIIRFYLVLNPTSKAANEQALGTNLLHLFVPQLFLLGGIAVTTALLNARRRFAAAAFSPVVNNVVAIGAIVAARMVATTLVLPGFSHDQSAVVILGLGTTAGYLFQFLVQVPSVHRSGYRLRPVWDLTHPAVRTVLRLSLWTFGSVIANQISFNLIIVLADHKSGDVTVFNTAYQFFQLPYAIFAVSIASVITPDLAEHWARRDLSGFRRQMANGLKLTLAVLVPAAVGYVVLAQPFLRLVLRHGSVSTGNAHEIATVVILFAAGLPGFSAYLLLMRGYQAMQDTRSMFWLYLFENIATIVLASALYPVMGVRGLALGWVGAYSIGAIAAFAHLRRRTGGLDGRAVLTGVIRVAAASALMILPVLALTHLLKGDSDLLLLTQVGGGVIAGSVVYLAAAQAFGITELTSLLRKRRPQ